MSLCLMQYAPLPVFHLFPLSCFVEKVVWMNFGGCGWGKEDKKFMRGKKKSSWGWWMFPLLLVLHLIEASPWVWNDFVLSVSINGGLTIDGIELDDLTHQQCSSELLEEGKSLSWLMLFICHIALFWTCDVIWATHNRPVFVLLYLFSTIKRLFAPPPALFFLTFPSLILTPLFFYITLSMICLSYFSTVNPTSPQ